MSNLIVDGFGFYGIGSATHAAPGAVGNALLAGMYAEIGAVVSGQAATGGVQILQGAPWDTSDTSYWLHPLASVQVNRTYGLRRVLPSTKTTVIISFHVGLSQIPPDSTSTALFDIRDDSNAIMGTLFVGSTGNLIWNFGNGTVKTSGPVLVAESAHHIEMKINKTSGGIDLYVDEILVLSTTVDFANDNPVAQYTVGSAATVTSVGDREFVYIADWILRDTTGPYNDDIVGDRRVAELLVNRDDVDHQGWAAEPLQRFGVGILDLADTANAVAYANSTSERLGASDFTIEGEVRFDVLPTGTNIMDLFSMWRASNNNRSWRLYLGGPGADNGLLKFQTSTDGTAGTTVDKYTWPWQPEVGVWHHIAMCRDGGNLKLFIDGIMQGLPIADADTYFAATAWTVLGGEQNTTGDILTGSTFDGWMDEVRITIGVSRYNANFTPPDEPFPRGIDDPDWAYVKLLCGFDTGTIADDGPLALTMVGLHGAAAIQPGDLAGAYAVLDKHTPSDQTFIEAALLPAEGTFTLTANPANTNTVTVGTKDGMVAAVYTFQTVLASAFDVLIGADLAHSAGNLVAAINAGVGAGVTYGTGTTANFDVTAALMPSEQVQVQAVVPGNAGNSIATTDTCPNGSWGDTHLINGHDIPGYSQFGMEPLPRDATIVDSITIVSRQWKTDAGTATTSTGLTGIGGANDEASARPITTIPTFYNDLFEEDPDSAAALTPQTVLTGRLRINRET